MESLSRWFEKNFFLPETPPPPRIFTVIGSGGKTSLIWHLAGISRGQKILVSPTAKMYPPPPEARLCDHCLPAPPARPAPLPGISMAGLFNEKTGKLEALPAGDLAALVPGYDLVFLEGDGSRGLPLKGWAEKEPAVPPNTTITIGLIPLSPLGKKVSKDTVFRLPLFTALCGAKEGDTLSISHLAAVITGNTRAKGLFDAARGKKLLFINHVEDDAARDQARELVSLLPENFLPGLCHIIAGSVRDDRVEVLYTGEGN